MADRGAGAVAPTAGGSPREGARTGLVERPQTARLPAADQRSVRLQMLDGFDLVVDGARVRVPVSAQRVIAFLGLQARAQDRGVVAGHLWRDATEARAHANLRAALWKLDRIRDRVVETRAARLALAPEVEVDVREVVRVARGMIWERTSLTPPPGPTADLIDRLTWDLLPDWDEDWLVFARERVRQLRIHAMEALARHLCDAGRHAEAVEVAMSAVAADPLRESAQRVLIQAYLAEDNAVEARRQYEAFRSILWRDLHVAPSPGLTDLVLAAGAGDSPGQRGH